MLKKSGLAFICFCDICMHVFVAILLLYLLFGQLLIFINAACQQAILILFELFRLLLYFFN